MREDIYRHHDAAREGRETRSDAAAVDQHAAFTPSPVLLAAARGDLTTRTPLQAPPAMVDRMRADLAKHPARRRRVSHLEAPFTHLRVEVLDEAAAFAIDGGLLEHDSVIRIVCAATEPFVLSVAGVEAVRLSPVDKSEDYDVRDPSLALYELVVAALGKDDTGETSTLMLAEGIETARNMLDGSWSLFELRVQCPEARVRMAEDIARSFGVPPAEIAKITKRPYTAARKLLSAPNLWKVVEERLRADAEAQARAEAERARLLAIANAPNTRSCHELGICAFRVKPAIGQTTERNPLDGGGIQIALPPELQGASTCAFVEADGSQIWICAAAPGVNFEKLTPSGAHYEGLPSGHVIPQKTGKLQEAIAGAGIATDGPVFFVMRMCQALPSDAARSGPVTRFGLAGVDRGRELAAEYALYLHYRRLGMQWPVALIPQLLVRGLRLNAIMASRVIWEAVEAFHKAQYPDYELPTSKGGPGVDGKWQPPSHVEHVPGFGERWKTVTRKVQRNVPPVEGPKTLSRAQLERLCIAAEATGFIAPGLLLGDLVEPQPKNEKRTR